MKKLKKLTEGGACKNSTTVPFDERPSVDRGQLGPFVRGYLDAALDAFPFNGLEDIGEPTLQQAVRDCVNFYWRCRDILEEMWDDPFLDFSQKAAGKCFWESRAGGRGFLAYDDPWDDDDRWTTLHSRAIGFGPFAMHDNDTTLDAYRIT